VSGLDPELAKALEHPQIRAVGGHRALPALLLNYTGQVANFIEAPPHESLMESVEAAGESSDGARPRERLRVVAEERMRASRSRVPASASPNCASKAVASTSSKRGETNLRAVVIFPIFSSVSRSSPESIPAPSRTVLPGAERHVHKPAEGHSITSSARAMSEGGIARPISLAVLRLMTSSNRVGCSTGSSAGLPPLRIFAT
jgi:hypothetical protein